MPLCLANRLNLNTLKFDQNVNIEANTRPEDSDLKKPSAMINLILKISHILKVDIIMPLCLANRRTLETLKFDRT